MKPVCASKSVPVVSHGAEIDFGARGGGHARGRVNAPPVARRVEHGRTLRVLHPGRVAVMELPNTVVPLRSEPKPVQT